jgi:hypothetical protein
MQLVEVKTRKHQKLFKDLPGRLYRSVPNYIQPLERDIDRVFDREKNPFFKQGECCRWLLIEGETVIGRLAAFTINLQNGQADSQIAGGIGFFECIDDQQAANTLFDHARDWLEQRNCTYMDGPVNFGKRDSWWGLLIKGHGYEPNYNSNYHLPYYKTLFENYGFRVYYQHYTYRKDTSEPVDDKLRHKAALVAGDTNYEVRNFDMDNYKKMVADVVEIYNKAWNRHDGVLPMSLDEAMTMFDKIKPVIDPRIMWFVYYKNRPVAFYLNIPEVNQIFKHVGNKMGVLGTLKFLWYRYFKKNKKMLGVVFGIVPEHQGKGLDGALVLKCYEELQRLKGRYQTLEISGIGDFNRKMIVVVRQVGGEICKVHATYRYLFDREMPFQRMQAIN